LENIPSLIEAVQARAWYNVVGFAVVILLAVVRSAPWAALLFEAIPDRVKWLPAVVLSGLSSGVLSWQAGDTWQVALGTLLFVMATGGPLAVGLHRVAKEAKPKLPRGGSGIAVLCLVLGSPLLSGCAALTSAVPIITAVAATMDRIAAEVDRMDQVVDSVFVTYPEIADLERGEWLDVIDAVHTARIALARAAEGAKGLDDFQKALAEFNAAWAAAQDWLRRHKILDAEGRYLVAGKVVGETAAPASFRAE
jgi:hypothetical protein